MIRPRIDRKSGRSNLAFFKLSKPVPMLHLTIWMNMPSFHQGDLFRALASYDEVDLEVIFAKDLTEARLRSGWHRDLTGYSYRFLNNRFPLLDALRLASYRRDRIHVVNGIWAEPSFVAALVALVLAGSRYAIYSEAPEQSPDRTLRGLSSLKHILKRALGRFVSARAAGMLAISHFAAEFLADLGAQSEIIYPFGYFRAKTRLLDRPIPRPGREGIEVIYAGQLINRKGVDLLIEAMAPLFRSHSDLSLSVLGGGQSLESLKEQVAASGLSGRVRFEGVMASESVQERLAVADLAVLPSRFDGWGMGVNEAFSVGIPVVVSDRCGAADLVHPGINGYVFGSEDVAGLRDCLTSFLENRDEWPRLRAGARETGRRISTGEVAPYLIECLKHMLDNQQARPRPPWTESDVVQAVNL